MQRLGKTTNLINKIVRGSSKRSFSSSSKFSSVATSGPCGYPGAVNATLTHDLKFRSSMNEDGTPFPIFSIMSNDGEIVNEKAFKEIDVSFFILASLFYFHHFSIGHLTCPLYTHYIIHVIMMDQYMMTYVK